VDETYAGAPRDAVEMELCGIWRSVLNRPAVNVNDNFFLDLGGSSLECVNIISAAGQAFGVSLRLTDFYLAPTLGAMAAQIRSGTSRTARGPVVQIQAGQGGEPVYVFHPLAGTVLCYVELARAMGPRHPLRGLQSEGLEPGSTPLTSIDAMADHYVAHMRTAHPSGPVPWNLIGYSMGGCLAVEVARRLNAQGERVRLVGLIDTDAPLGSEILSVDTIRENAIRGIARHYLHVDVDINEFRHQTTEEKLRELHSRGVAAETLPVDYNLDILRRLVAVHIHNRLAIGSYCPDSYKGALTLFRASPPDAASGVASEREDLRLGWSRIADTFHVHDIPCDHFSIMDMPAVAQIAQAIYSYLEGQAPSRLLPS